MIIYNYRSKRLLLILIIIIYNRKGFKKFNNLIINKSKKILIYNKVRGFIIKASLKNL